MADPLPIGVVIPTLNCASLLPGHLESINEWLDLAAEVVVVDSESTDGTADLLRTRLRHGNLRVLSHPRGLYQSWNFGIRNISAKYVYMATVGDSITRAGLERLFQGGEKLEADVMVSKPAFIDNEGAQLASDRWPIDDLCDTLGVRDFLAVEGVVLYVLALVNCPGAILGSSASNLYRTNCLRRFPFPADFGTVGDGAWGLRHALDIRLGIATGVFSTFRQHPKAYKSSDYAVTDLAGRLHQAGCASWREHCAGNEPLRKLGDELGVPRIIEETGKHLGAQRVLEIARDSKVPWVFNPRAWAARSRRGFAFRTMHQLKQQAVSRHFESKKP